MKSPAATTPPASQMSGVCKEANLVLQAPWRHSPYFSRSSGENRAGKASIYYGKLRNQKKILRLKFSKERYHLCFSVA